MKTTFDRNELTKNFKFNGKSYTAKFYSLRIDENNEDYFLIEYMLKSGRKYYYLSNDWSEYRWDEETSEERTLEVLNKLYSFSSDEFVSFFEDDLEYALKETSLFAKESYGWINDTHIKEYIH